jgi:hypothetical protein
MIKRLVIIGAVVGGAVFLRNKAKQQQAEQDLWTAATDDVQAPVASAPVAPAAPAATQTGVPADAAAAGDDAPTTS